VCVPQGERRWSGMTVRIGCCCSLNSPAIYPTVLFFHAGSLCTEMEYPSFTWIRSDGVIDNDVSTA
jgi:hypothetical protein